ncbi:hypothetical protein KY347_01585 [Candidatus Woesearchaeota archaeon]|nr:hypothetical protein [Candidatus Woesearchaeota archaeon]
MTPELFTIINGEIIYPQDLRLKGASLVDTFDITGKNPLFSNPFGLYSQVSLEELIRRINSEKSNRVNLTLKDAIGAVNSVQHYIEGSFSDYKEAQSANDLRGWLISTYIQLKGYHIDEVAEQISQLRNFVSSLSENTDTLLGRMLGFEGDANKFFESNNVLEKFGIVQSGNLGLYESAVLLYTGILAQAAKNGQQLSIVIKPSIQDFLTYHLIMEIPPEFKKAFYRITWSSDWEFDLPLIKKLTNSLDGAIYFGARKNLEGFKRGLSDPVNPNHHFYYDHFPILVIGPYTTDKQLKSAAKLAVNLSYKNKGESCLSLQDIFVHENLNDIFLTYIMEEKRKLGQSDGYIPMPKFSSSLLRDLIALREKLLQSGAYVSGRVFPESNTMDLLLAYGLDPNNPILGTENGAPFLAVSPYSDDNKLVEALRTHLKPGREYRTVDKHIYSIIIGVGEKSPIVDYAHKNSHRVSNSTGFGPYTAGVPHCGGISFLADMFGIPHLSQCYFDPSLVS